MTEAYFLTSARLGFRRWTREDIDLATSLWGEPEVNRFLGGPFTPEQVSQKLATEMDRMENHGIQYWPVFLLESGEHVGCCGLRPYQPEERIPELGYHLRRAFWGKGLAVEASRAVIAYAFDTLGCAALFAGHHPDNAVSKKVLLKLGFRYLEDVWHEPIQRMEPTYLLRCAAASQLST